MFTFILETKGHSNYFIKLSNAHLASIYSGPNLVNHNVSDGLQYQRTDTSKSVSRQPDSLLMLDNQGEVMTAHQDIGIPDDGELVCHERIRNGGKIFNDINVDLLVGSCWEDNRAYKCTTPF